MAAVITEKELAAPAAPVVPAEPAEPAAVEAPATRRTITPGVGSVSNAIVTQNPLLENSKVWIGIIVGLIITVILFMLPSNKLKIPAKVQRRR